MEESGLQGSASLVGSLVKKYLGKKLFDLQGAPEAASNPISGGTSIKLENTDGAGSRLIYDLGLLGCELLVSMVGFEKFVNIWRESGNGKKFSDAFQDATGIELKDFYLMFEEIRPIIIVPRS